MRPCLERLPDGRPCPNLTTTTRCPHHTRQRDRARRPSDQYGGEYQANRRKLLARGDPCYVPGCSTHATTADHIRPLRDGGTHDLWNLRPSCPRHNMGRRD